MEKDMLSLGDRHQKFVQWALGFCTVGFKAKGKNAELQTPAQYLYFWMFPRKLNKAILWQNKTKVLSASLT